jgi:hypothetical protein
MIHRSLLSRIANWAIAHLPLPAAILKYSPPAWTLPSTVVVKKKKPGWDDEFEHELAIYRSLHDLQGRVIPYSFGDAWCENWRIEGEPECRDKRGDVCVCQRAGRAVVLSDVGRITLSSRAALDMDEVDLRNRCLRTFEVLRDRGYWQDDSKLDNYHLVDGSVFVVDLETMNAIPLDKGVTREWVLDVWLKGVLWDWRYLKQSVDPDSD